MREERAGEWCWNELKDCEYDLVSEKKMCVWRMKSAGHLRFRTENAVKRCDTCIVQKGIAKPKIPKDRPTGWEADPDWAEEVAEFTEAEIEKLKD